MNHFFTGFGLLNLSFHGLIWVLVGLGVIWIALRRKTEPLLLLSLGLGIVVGNVPARLGLGTAIGSPGALFGLLDWLRLLTAQGVFPALLFLALGAATDFGPLIARPRLALLAGGAAAGLFLAVLLGAVLLGMSPRTAAAVAIAGGAQLPLTLYTAGVLNARVLGAAVLVAYALLALGPRLQSPVLRLLTSPAERRIRMAPAPPPSARLRLIFPILVFICGALFIPGARAPLAMLCLGNFLRECGVSERLKHALSGAFYDTVAVFAGFAAGLATAGERFLSLRTVGGILVGLAAFVLATAAGVLFAKLLNLFARSKINPLLAGAALGAPAGLVKPGQELAEAEEPGNPLGEAAAAAGLGGLIALILAAGMMLSL